MNTPLSRNGITSTLGKNTSEVKSLVPPELREELAALAVLNRQTVSEYVRDLLVCHVHGHLHALRLRSSNGTPENGRE